MCDVCDSVQWGVIVIVIISLLAFIRATMNTKSIGIECSWHAILFTVTTTYVLLYDTISIKTWHYWGCICYHCVYLYATHTFLGKDILVKRKFCDRSKQTLPDKHPVNSVI